MGFALLGLLPSCRFLQGRRVWADWQEIQKGDTFYVVLPYKQLGDVYLLAGLIGIVAVIYLALRGRRHVIGTVTAAVAFICAIIGPTVLYPSTPEYDTPIHARHGVARVMNGSLAALDQWTKQAGHLPASEAEFRDAVRDKVWLNRRSSYAYVGQPPPPSSQSKFDSQRLPYRLVFISGVTGPTFYNHTRWTLLLCTSGSVPIYALLG